MGLIKDLKRYDNLLDLLDDDSVQPEEVEAAIAEAGKSLPDAVDDFATFLRDLQSRAEIIKGEERRLAARRRSLENLESRLRDAASYWMKKADKPKLKGAFNTIALRTSEAVIVDELSALPSAFVKIEYLPQKLEIKRAIKAGEKVQGAHLETRESLIIR